MKEILERFKTEKLAVNCQTEEEAKQFVKLCYENGIEWYYDNIASETHFNSYEEHTCYAYSDGNLVFYSNEYAKPGGRTCIGYSDFMEEYNNLSESDQETDITPIQSQNYLNMLAALGLKQKDLTESVQKSIAYLAMDEVSTIDNLCTAIKQSRGVQ